MPVGAGSEVDVAGSAVDVGALLVVLTGRIWGAVLVHVVYNGTMIAVIAAGTILR